MLQWSVEQVLAARGGAAFAGCLLVIVAGSVVFGGAALRLHRLDRARRASRRVLIGPILPNG